MNENNTNSEPAGQLDWLAFQYTAGEMTAEQAAEFEDRLAEDQMAREAVAGAVELSMAIARVAAEPVVAEVVRLRPGKPISAEIGDGNDSSVARLETHRRWIRPTVWLTAAAAACLAAVVFWQGLNSVPYDSSDTPTEVETGLAQIWADTLSDEFSSASFNTRTDDGQESGVADSSSPVDANEEPLAPDWLMAALADEPEMNVEMNEAGPSPGGS